VVRLNYCLRYDTKNFACAQKLMSSQLSPRHHTKLKRKLINKTTETREHWIQCITFAAETTAECSQYVI